MKLQHLLVAAAAVALAAGSLIAADHPDMAGTWTVDPARSDFGPTPVPPDIVVTIKADGPDYQLTQTGGGQPDMTVRFSTSGKEVTNDLPGGGKMTSTHRWEGQALVGEVKILTPDGATLTFKDNMTFSADGKVMTQKRAISGPMGDGQMTIVLNRK